MMRETGEDYTITDQGATVQYLTVRESVKRLRRAGLPAREETVRDWVRSHRVRDVWVLGRHTYIYDEELEALIEQELH